MGSLSALTSTCAALAATDESAVVCVWVVVSLFASPPPHLFVLFFLFSLDVDTLINMVVRRLEALASDGR